MFTGIVEELGTVRYLKGSGHSLALSIGAAQVLAEARVGDSIAVNGVCLTVTHCTGDSFTAEVMPETFARTALQHLTPGAPVNLERSLPANGRFGGHIVQGHVDGVGTVTAVAADEIARVVTIAAPPAILRYVVPKGSVAVDGVSLTVVTAADDRFSVSLIPHTASVTTLGRRRVGDRVNLEADILGKYLERLLSARLGPGDERPAGTVGLTHTFLARHGYVNEAEE